MRARPPVRPRGSALRSATRLSVLSALALSLGLSPALVGRLAAQAAPAEPPPPGAAFSEAIDVDVVNLEVFVADRAGRPVAGLAQDDFELRLDGKSVPLTNFSAFAPAGSPGARPAGAAPESGAAAPAAIPAAPGIPAAPAPEDHLTLALFLDNLNLTPDIRNQMLQQVTGFFRTGLGPRDRVLIASYDPRGMRLRQPPPGDVQALLAALREAATLATKGTSVRAERHKIISDFDQAETEAEFEEAQERQEMLDIEHEGDATRGLRALVRFAGALGGLRGRKALLYVASEQPVPLGDALYRELAERANAGRVTLYALGRPEDVAMTNLDLQSVDNLEDSPLADTRPVDALAQTLQQMVGPTGGLSLIDPNRPALLLERIREDFSSFYSLGFAPPPAPGSGAAATHRIEVRVRGRSGLRVRFPATYAVRSREERLADRTRTALRIDAAEGVDNPLGVRLGFERDELAAYGRRAVTVLVTLPLARVTLRPGQGVHDGKVEMFLAVRDSTGHELRMRRITIPVHVPDGELAAVARKSAAYRLRLDLPPGTSTLALGVRDELGSLESTVATKYVAGALAAAKAAVGPAGTAPPPGGR
jgi:VWFA-related protein